MPSYEYKTEVMTHGFLGRKEGHVLIFKREAG